MEQNKEQEILNTYRQYVLNTQEALRLSGMPESMIFYHTLNAPDWSKLIPEDAVKFYKEIKRALIIYLFKIGFSEREIAKRLGGHTLNMVFSTLQNEKEGVTNSKTQHDKRSGNEDAGKAV